MPIKNFKVPEVWNAETAKIIENMFETLYNETQNKYHTIINETPKTTEGKNGEIKIDEKNSRLYVKLKGVWKSVLLN